jgi:hypothetical protein
MNDVRILRTSASFRAFDADTGRIMWESILGGIVSTSTITYAVTAGLDRRVMC